MAGAATIGALRVVIGADTAALDKGLKDAQGSLAGFGSGMKLAGAAVAGVMAGIVGGMAASIKKTIDRADELGNVANKIGMPVEELSALKYAAEFSDVSMQSLSKAMLVLDKNMSAVAGGAKGPAADAFKAMGISVVDASGKLKTQGQVVNEVANKFEGYSDSAAKTALASAIMGKAAGPDMIPLLNEGGKGIDALKLKAKQLGIVISKEMSDDADTFNKKLFDVGKMGEAVSLKITASLLPGLNSMASVMKDVANNSAGMDMAAQGIVFVMRSLATVVLAAGTALFTFSTSLAALIAAGILAASGEMSAAKDALVQGFDDVVGQFKTGGELIAKTWSSVGPAVASTTDKIKKGMAPVIEVTKAAADAVTQFLNAEEKKRVGMEAEIATMGMGAGATAAYKLEQMALTIAEQKGIPITAARLLQIQQEAEAMGKLTQQVEDARNAWSFANSTADASAGAFADWAMGTKTAAEAFKDFATSVIRDVLQMIAKFIILRAVVAPVMGGFFGAGGFAGLLGMPGLGFASGGSFTVPGGSSMTDNQMVPLNLAAGERVTIDSNHNGASSSQDRATTILLQTHPRSDQSVRDFIYDLVRVSGDMPVKLKLA